MEKEANKIKKAFCHGYIISFFYFLNNSQFFFLLYSSSYDFSFFLRNVIPFSSFFFQFLHLKLKKNVHRNEVK